MVALITGIVLFLFTLFSLLPPTLVGFGLGWGSDVVVFLKGGLPIISAFIGLVALFIGIADLKDKKEAKREEEMINAKKDNN